MKKELLTLDLKKGVDMKKFIAWGHKLHSHTHSYIHYGYIKAAKALEFDTYWINESDVIPKLDEGDIFFTEGQVDYRIPLIKNARYILHHCNNDKYIGHGCKIINLCNYVEPCERGISMNYGMDTSAYVKTVEHGKVCKIKDFCFYDKENKALYQPWATDLLQKK